MYQLRMCVSAFEYLHSSTAVMYYKLCIGVECYELVQGLIL